MTIAQKKAAPSSPKDSKAPSSKVDAPNKAISAKSSAKPVDSKMPATNTTDAPKTPKKSATTATPPDSTPKKDDTAAVRQEDTGAAMDDEEDEIDDRSTSQKKKAVTKAAKPVEPALNFTCKHSQLQWISPKYNFNIAKTGPIIEKAKGICGGISAGTCCDQEMFETIEQLWLNEMKKKNYLPRVYFGLMKDILAYRVPIIIKLAVDYMHVVRNLYYKYGAVPKRQFKAFKYISKGTFDVPKKLRVWRASALKCSTHMQSIAKGSLCALCHTQGYKRFSDDVYTDPKTSKKKNIVYVPKVDVYNWMQACQSSMKETEKMRNFLGKVVQVLLWKKPQAMGKLEKLLPKVVPKKIREATERAMNKCFGDIKFCDQPHVLRMYINAPITRKELSLLPVTK